MAAVDVEMHGFDSESVLSKPLSPDTLEARIMVHDACGNALDTLAIPATATDCEKIFSSGWKLIS